MKIERKNIVFELILQVEYLPLCHGCPALSPPSHGFVRITPIEGISNSKNRLNIMR